MAKFQRYGIYFTPQGALAADGSAWLGWDLSKGCAVAHPELGPDLTRLTARPRKYGFHATLKAPFALAEGTTAAELTSAVSTLANRLAPVSLGRLEVAQLGPFLVLKPSGGYPEVSALAALAVRALDCFRAPPTEAELTRRQQSRLSARQEQNLLEWGYPHVMDDFRFHMTLTGRLKAAEMAHVLSAAQAYFAPSLADLLWIDGLTVVGQGEDEMFYEIERFRL